MTMCIYYDVLAPFSKIRLDTVYTHTMFQIVSSEGKRCNLTHTFNWKIRINKKWGTKSINKFLFNFGWLPAVLHIKFIYTPHKSIVPYIKNKISVPVVVPRLHIGAWIRQFISLNGLSMEEKATGLSKYFILYKM